MIGLVARRVRHLGWRRGLRVWLAGAEAEGSGVDFYERLLVLLEKQGIKREPYQTPLEFASLIGIEASAITNAYNRVRFGKEKLSAAESRRLEEALTKLEKGVSR